MTNAYHFKSENVNSNTKTTQTRSRVLETSCIEIPCDQSCHRSRNNYQISFNPKHKWRCLTTLVFCLASRGERTADCFCWQAADCGSFFKTPALVRFCCLSLLWSLPWVLGIGKNICVSQWSTSYGIALLRFFCSRYQRKQYQTRSCNPTPYKRSKRIPTDCTACIGILNCNSKIAVVLNLFF